MWRIGSFCKLCVFTNRHLLVKEKVYPLSQMYGHNAIQSVPHLAQNMTRGQVVQKPETRSNEVSNVEVFFTISCHGSHKHVWHGKSCGPTLSYGCLSTPNTMVIIAEKNMD